MYWLVNQYNLNMKITDLIKKEDFNSTDNKETPVPKKDRINLQEIDDRLLTIDDFLN